MKRVGKKILMILGILFAIGIVLFLCRDSIVNSLFYDMDSQMDLPKDIKDDPKYAPDSSSKIDMEIGKYAIRDSVDGKECYSFIVSGNSSHHL